MKVRFSFLVAKGYITHLNDFFSPATSRFASNLATCFISVLKFEDVQFEACFYLHRLSSLQFCLF